MRTLISTATTLALVLVLAGCSGSDVEPEASSSPSSTAAEDIDRTAAAQDVAGDIVTAAREDSEGWLFVDTTLTAGEDPAEAIAACEALVEAGYAKVNLAEADGSSYVLAGHPMYGDACTAI